MRAAVRTLAACGLLVFGGMSSVVTTGCIPDEDKQPDWQKPPKEWDPKGDSLTFGEKNLDAFNSMSKPDRAAHLEALKGKAGSFKGQARFQRLEELGEKVDDSEYGSWEIFATLDEPVLYEITVEYRLFAADKLEKYPPGTYVEFTGTLADFSFQDQSKPRKIEIKVKDVALTRLGS